MLNINGYEISKAFTGGEPVNAIYSFGVKVWPVDQPISFGGLKFTALEAGSFGMEHNGTNATTTKPSLSYSKNGSSWTEWDYTNISVNAGDFVYFKGVNNIISNSTSDYSKFTSTGRFNASGNIMSLLYGDDYEGKFDLTGREYCFDKLFYNCYGLITSPELPATTLAGYCYGYMFYGCTSLKSAPELPATTLAGYCYDGMFYKCASLVNAPELPATKLAPWCYYGMFRDCISLASAPELPATELEYYCYGYMFEGCESLTSTPELPAIELVNKCYECMFYKCSKLNYVKAEFITEPYIDYTYYWLYGVAKTGTFVANPSATWPSKITRSEHTVPYGWTITK